MLSRRDPPASAGHVSPDEGIVQRPNKFAGSQLSYRLDVSSYLPIEKLVLIHIAME